MEMQTLIEAATLAFDLSLGTVKIELLMEPLGIRVRARNEVKRSEESTLLLETDRWIGWHEVSQARINVLSITIRNVHSEVTNLRSMPR